MVDGPGCNSRLSSSKTNTHHKKNYRSVISSIPTTMKLITVISLSGVAVPLASAFATSSRNGVQDSMRSMSSTGTSEDLGARLPTQKGKKRSESIPFLQCPQVLKESDLAGNVGFDPLGFAKNKEQLWEMREAEIKHARLAMLVRSYCETFIRRNFFVSHKKSFLTTQAAVGWPVSELMDRSIADFFGAPALLDDGDRVPTVLNGGLGKVPPQWWGFCIGMCAAIDMYGVAKARRGDPEYFPGNLGFDPLNLYPDTKEGRDRVKLAEIKHGRSAMIGVLGYVVEEYITKMAVVDDTPILFQPITETVEEVIFGVEGAIAGVMLLL
jgi:hypothetical protein